MKLTKIPHTFAITSCIILFCALLTWVIPAGEYNREVRLINETERTVIVDNSFHSVDASPQSYQVFEVLLEGFGLGVLLMLVCAFGIRSGAVGMVHLYHEPVQARCGVYSCRYLKGIRKSTPACIFASATTPRRRPCRL